MKCNTIWVSPDGIAEIDANKIVILVPATEIERITLRFGRSEHRPIVTFILGGVLSLGGVFGVILLIVAPGAFRYEMGLLVFGVIGSSLIFDALKQRYFLEVRRKRDDRRLVFSKVVQKKEIEEFCERARAVYGYDITDAC